MIFCVKISIKFFYRLVVLCLLVIAKHTQNTQNGKFVTSLQCLETERRDKVDFMDAGKHQIIP